MSEVLLEAFVVGIIVLIIAVPVMSIQHTLLPNIPGKKPGSAKYYVSTVIIGVLVHLLCEYTGVNKYYCKNGYACVTD